MEHVLKHHPLSRRAVLIPALRLAAFSAVSSAASLAPAIADARPSAAAILFERPNLQKLKTGDVVTYDYRFSTGDPSLFGPAFADKVKMTVVGDKAGDQRSLDVELFSGDRRRAAGPFDDVASNPILILMLEEHLQRLAALFQANPRYMKTAIRLALRNAVATPDAATGGWIVEVAPFKDDPHKARMHGLDALVYRFSAAPDTPGEIVAIDISARDDKSMILFEEATRYAG